jgi:hypothetical protein
MRLHGQGEQQQDGPDFTLPLVAVLPLAISLAILLLF